MAREEAKKLPESTPAESPKMIKAEVRRKSGMSDSRIPYNVATPLAPNGTGFAFYDRPTTVEGPEELIALLESKKHALHVARVDGSRVLPDAAELRTAQGTIESQREEIAKLKETLRRREGELALIKNPEDESPGAPVRPAPPAGLPRMG